MPALIPSRWRAFLAAALLLLTPPLAAAASGGSAAAVAKSETPDQALVRALELERAHDWSSAIELYEDALDLWPSRTDFRHRLRLCEVHYRLGRRYQDRSFRDVLLRLPRADALDLFDELIERIDTAYVESIRFEPLLRQGFDNLEVALRDPVFLQTHGLSDPGRARWLRDAFRGQRDAITAASRREARAVVEAACDLGAAAPGSRSRPSPSNSSLVPVTRSRTITPDA